MNEDQPASVLTPTQREYLFKNEKDRQPGEERKLKSRIRDRVFAGVIDGDYLWSDLAPDERRKIFDMTMRNADSTGEQAIEIQRDDDLETLHPHYHQFHHGVTSWLAFLYAGVEEAEHVYDITDPKIEYSIGENPDDGSDAVRTPNVRFDFERMFREAISWAVRKRGEELTEFELTIETEPLKRRPSDVDLDDAEERFYNREHVTALELHTLRSEGRVDEEDAEGYFSEDWDPDFDNKGRGGMVGFGGVSDMLDEAREDDTEE